MPEAEVLYSDIKFKRARGNTDVATPSTDEPTYSEVKISKAQRPAELPASNRRSGVTSERVALLVLSVLLAAALIALGVTLYENTQIKKSLQKLQEEPNAKHLSGNLSGTEPSIVEQPTTPPLVREETCPRCEHCWEPHEGKRYFFSSDKLTWDQSRTQCKSMRGDLVVINNEEEQKFLKSRLSVIMHKPEDKFWIGLIYSNNKGKWLWVDNTQLNTSWVFRRPKDNSDGKDCVRMVWQKKGDTNLKIWFDKSCKSSQKYICEKPEEA